MSADKYPSIFSRQMGTIVYIFPHFQNCTCCEKDLKDNKHNSLHLERRYARIIICPWASSVPRSSQTLSENCFILETDNVREQISKHIFAPNGGYCLFIYTFLVLNFTIIILPCCFSFSIDWEDISNSVSDLISKVSQGSSKILRWRCFFNCLLGVRFGSLAKHGFSCFIYHLVITTVFSNNNNSNIVRKIAIDIQNQSSTNKLGLPEPFAYGFKNPST